MESVSGPLLSLKTINKNSEAKLLSAVFPQNKEKETCFQNYYCNKYFVSECEK